ncbi:MAG: DUF434 domain-containing protein [Desulfurococcales archaeon]|jgi:hypothetical protein|nr:DUF434 domain-containing protein [Desulfurococcales archaeon]
MSIKTVCVEPDQRIINAIIDYKYLLDRGYGQKISADIVSSRYILNSFEREFLIRCIHRSDYVREILKKKVSEKDLRRNVLIIDLMNVTSTLGAALKDECVYRCDDTFIRDIRGSKTISKNKDLVKKIFELIIDVLKDLECDKSFFVLDKNISYSIILMREIELIASSKGVYSENILAEKADKTLIERSREGVVASSDYVVLEKVLKTFDLAGHIIERYRERFPESLRIIDINSVL